MIVAVDFLAVPDREKTEVEFFISDQRLLAVTAHLNRRDRDTWKFFQKLRIDMGKHADATTGSDSEGEMSRFASEHIGDLVASCSVCGKREVRRDLFPTSGVVDLAQIG